MKAALKLRSMPLFQGMSSDDITALATRVRLTPGLVPRGSVIADEGGECKALILVVSGSLAIHTRAAAGACEVIEKVEAPALIEPERLFGLNTHYCRRYVALAVCHVLAIEKADVRHLIGESLVFRVNLLNAISTLAQRRAAQPLRPRPTGLRAIIIRFLADQCILPAGQKTFHVTRERLARETGYTRREVGAELNAMRADSLIKTRRGSIDIPELRLLIGG